METVCIFACLFKLKNGKAIADIKANMIMVDNFFAHWIKEINIKRYGDD